jgi:hypothetical protein
MLVLKIINNDDCGGGGGGIVYSGNLIYHMSV